MLVASMINFRLVIINIEYNSNIMQTFIPIIQSKMIPPGIEPGTVRVWGGRDNRYTTKSVIKQLYETK